MYFFKRFFSLSVPFISGHKSITLFFFFLLVFFVVVVSLNFKFLRNCSDDRVKEWQEILYRGRKKPKKKNYTVL